MNTTGFKIFGLFNFSLHSRNAAKRLKKVEIVNKITFSQRMHLHTYQRA